MMKFFKNVCTYNFVTIFKYTQLNDEINIEPNYNNK